MKKIFTDNLDNGIQNALLEIKPNFSDEHIKTLPIDVFENKLNQLNIQYEILLDYSKKELNYQETATHPIKEFISAIDSFYDSIFLILKYKYNKATSKDSKNAIAWLRKENKPIYNQFTRPTNSIFEKIRKISNVMKHDVYDIREIQIINHKNQMVRGFNISTIVQDDQLRGPNTDIHPLYKGKYHTGISYNHLMLLSVYNILNITDTLMKILNPKKIINTEFQVFSRLLELGSRIPNEFFPDEYKIAYAKIVKLDNNNFKVEYPYRYKMKKENPDHIFGCQCQLGYNSRENRSYEQIPYLFKEISNAKT